jgi:hypothetical protein
MWYNIIMDELERERIRQWIRNWEAAGPVLQRLRDEAIRNTDTAAAIEQLSDAYESARLHWAPPTTSGLVEQQRWFARLRP